MERLIGLVLLFVTMVAGAQDGETKEERFVADLAPEARILHKWRGKWNLTTTLKASVWIAEETTVKGVRMSAWTLNNKFINSQVKSDEHGSREMNGFDAMMRCYRKWT